MKYKDFLLALALAGSGGGSGGGDYANLSNLPQIKGVTLSGDKTAADLGLAALCARFHTNRTTLSRQIKAARKHYEVLAASPALQSPIGYLDQRRKDPVNIFSLWNE